MKKILIPILIFLIQFTANSTPYIIPDIGSPGMNTYIEIIGDNDPIAKYYGNDGIYPNNPSSPFYIELLSPSDSNKITFGPLIVSWNGRMISTQVFVNPNLSPPDWDFNKNGPQWSVNFSVHKGSGNLAPSFEFKIVQPFPFPKNGERVFGEGTLGKRSPKGAMIVDSLDLSPNSIYTVSTKDPDLSAASFGNEAYLPFILLSKGPIKANSSTISISSNTKDAAPGGGGGGGRNCDNITNTDPGGNGFTGGGYSGYYQAPSTNKIVRSGDGSGKFGSDVNTGDAINGTVGGQIINLKESSGGGTGHPFGKSGTGWNGGGTDPGAYGGGTGALNNLKGGSGAYATDGQGTDGGFTTNGGKKHGNDMGVPFAGGSGGASGNPKAAFPSPLTVCSGAGGAGGGAIRIYGKQISDINIDAKGSNGESGTPGGPQGGGGSGGMIEINSKLPSGVASLNVSSSTGGAGRVRNNTPLLASANLNIPSNGGTNYYGFTSDTLTWCNPVFDYKGTCPANAKIQVWLKADHGQWNNLGYVANTSSGNWLINIDTKALGIEKEKIYYLVASMDVDSPKKISDFEHEPNYIFSQAAANVVRPMFAPDINSKTTLTYNLKFCKDAEIIDSVEVTNTGNDNLVITYANLWKFGDKGFSFVGPNIHAPLKPNEKVFLVFKYKPLPGQNGFITDTLWVSSNVLNVKKNPWKIAINVNLQAIKLEFDDLNNKKLDTIFFKQACVGKADTVYINLKNISSIDFPIDKIYTSNLTDFDSKLADISNSKTITSNDFRKVILVYNDTDGNLAEIGTKLYVTSKDCSEVIDSIFVLIKVLRTKLILADPADVDFVDTKIGTTKSRTIRIINTATNGNGAYIKNFPTIVPPFKFIKSKPPIPTYLKAGDTLFVNVDFTPIAEVASSLPTSLSSNLTDTTCDFNFPFTLKGNGIKSLINFPTDTIRFKPQLYCESNQDISVPIGNDLNSKSSFSILSEKIVGPQAGAFRITQSINKKTLKPGENDNYHITYNPLKSMTGISNATLEIYTDDDLNKTIRVYLKGEMEGLKMSIDKPQPLDFGDVPIFSTKNDNFTVTNNGTIGIVKPAKRTIISIVAKPELVFTPTFGGLVVNGGTQLFNVAFTPTVAGPFYSDVKIIFGGADCPDTLFYSIIGNGLLGSVSISGTLDFGIKTPCQSETGKVTITSTGTAPIMLDTVYIQGGNANLFSLGTKITKVPLKKGESADAIVNYNPKGKSYGIKSTQIVVLTTANGKQDTTKRNVIIEIISGLDLVPDNLVDFGSEPINFDIFKNASLSKSPKATWNLSIEQTQALKTYSNIFKFDKTKIDNYNFGLINPIAITANGLTNQLYVDTLFIPFIMNNDCRDTVFFALKFNAVPAASVKLRLLNSMLLDPEDAVSKIPIYAVISSGIDTVKQATFDNINLTFDQNIFYPTSVNKGKILSYKALNGIVTLSIKTDSTMLTKNETLLAEVLGKGLLGPKETSSIILDSVINSQKKLISKVDTSSGIITIKICKAGGSDRLINNSSAMKLTDLLLNDYIMIEANVIEIGKHKLEIIDATGALIKKYEWEHFVNSNPIYNFEIQSDKLTNGAYFIVLSSENRTISKPFFINK